jgi:hypothetical protein
MASIRKVVLEVSKEPRYRAQYRDAAGLQVVMPDPP